MVADTVSIRRATSADAPECGRICYEAFAKINAEYNFPPEVPNAEVAQQFLGAVFSHPGFFAVLAEIDSRIVGSNCLDERTPIAGLGPISIDPEVQDRGIDRKLMECVLDRAAARNFAGVRLLQSAFHGRSLALYAKLGFQVREPIVAMSGPPIGLSMPGHTVRHATPNDLQACDRICARIHGHDRSGELRDAIEQGAAKVVERDGQVSGYTTALGYFGHAVAESTADLKALIGEAEEFQGLGILVPIRNTELFKWSLENGLRVIQPNNLMTIGLYNEPAGPYLPSILY